MCNYVFRQSSKFKAINNDIAYKLIKFIFSLISLN